MELEKLLEELRQVQIEKEDVFEAMMVGRENREFLDPWEFHEYSRIKPIRDGGRAYSKLIHRERHLQKLIARSIKNYEWSVKRFKA